MSLVQGDEIQKILDDVRAKTSMIKAPNYNKFQNGFSHIFSGGYAAGYYSYKWAEVLSADAFFACLDANNDFDKQKAKEYKHHILEKGSSLDMRDLYLNWLGNEPRLDSLFRLYGLQ